MKALKLVWWLYLILIKPNKQSILLSIAMVVFSREEMRWLKLRLCSCCWVNYNWISVNLDSMDELVVLISWGGRWGVKGRMAAEGWMGYVGGVCVWGIPPPRFFLRGMKGPIDKFCVLHTWLVCLLVCKNAPSFSFIYTAKPDAVFVIYKDLVFFSIINNLPYLCF
jgi:hypothetical protein